MVEQYKPGTTSQDLADGQISLDTLTNKAKLEALHEFIRASSSPEVLTRVYLGAKAVYDSSDSNTKNKLKPAYLSVASRILRHENKPARILSPRQSN